jgi:diguanylate cyclase (GGDEF)-like protein/PAS domain S-box-containing protein
LFFDDEAMKKKILIVEDERIIALDLKFRLMKFGFTITDIVSSGSNVLSAVEKSNPDIALMDIMLEGDIDGIEAAVTLQQKYGIPSIFITAYADNETISRAQRANPLGYILKPFKERELYTTVHMALNKNRVDQELKQQKHLFSSILNSVGDGIIAVDSSNRIQFMNAVAEKLTGWQEEEAIEKDLKTVFSLYDPEGNSRIELPAKIEEIQEPYISFREIILENRNNQRIYLEGGISPVKISDESLLETVIVFRDVTTIKDLRDSIHYKTRNDHVTELANRETFLNWVADAVKEDNEKNTNHCLLHIDIDRFRMLNELSGHSAGDNLLRFLSDIIRGEVDEPHLVGRIGSDDFGVLLRETSVQEGKKTAERIRKAAKVKFNWGKTSFPVTVSIGIVPVSTGSEDLFALFATADDTCTLAKEEGGNRIRYVENANITILKRRGELGWFSRLENALDNDQFCLEAQPIISLETMDGNRSEVLLRLKEARGQKVPPGKFIPVAERYKLMPAIDRWVIHSVIKKMADGLSETGGKMLFFVNISGQTLSDEGFVRYVADLIARYNVPPESFCFEITETAAISKFSNAMEFVRSLKNIGCTFALDDFGNGFSSFSYLKRLPLDYLKIDGSFVRNLTEDQRDYAMVEAINKVGHALGMKTIAEFVETQEIWNNLKEIGVDFGQGYGLGMPAPFLGF